MAFDPYFPLPLEAWEWFVNLGSIIEVEKEEIVKESFATERYFYFVLSGSGGVFVWKENNYVCIDLCYENDFFGDYMSFLTQQPSPLEVRCFEKTTLFRISKDRFNKMSVESEFGDKMCRIAAEALFIHKQQQQIDILTKSARERYLTILEYQGELLQKTPQKHIASYLGITPQSLSRIRKKIAIR